MNKIRSSCCMKTAKQTDSTNKVNMAAVVKTFNENKISNIFEKQKVY